MFDFLFGWRKASKCKKLIKRARCRLKLLKIKRCSIVRHLRDDMACLITNGYEQTAFNRVEQLIKDESTMAVYELLDTFCEFILAKLSYIRRHKDVPDDINEAISSLIFASARCGDLPELKLIRELFGERYGRQFAMAALELCPGNLVNDLIKEKLCIKSVPEHAKRRLVDEIAEDCIKTDVLALEYKPEWHQKQVKEKEDPKTHYPITNEPPSKDSNISVDTIFDSSKLAIVPYEFPYRPDRYIDSEAHLLSNSLNRLIVSSPADSNGRSSSSESLPLFSMDTIVYLDDIVELQSPAAKEEHLQDQRVFKFTSNMASKTHSFKQSFESEKPRSKSCRISGNGSGKRRRVRLASKESINMKNSDFISYYSNSSKTNTAKKQKPHHHLQHLKKLMAEEDEWRSSMEVSSNVSSCKCHYNPDSHESNDCSLDYPCYFCTNGDKDDKKMDPRKQKLEIETQQYINFSIKQRSSSKNDISGHPKFSRASTMPPPERPKDAHKDTIPRSNSCPYEQPKHVHPKLPDYDDLAAKFKALKREQLGRTQNSNF